MAKRDFQRKRVYDWEGEELPFYWYKKITLDECTTIANAACRAYGLRVMPSVAYTKRKGYALGGSKFISLPSWGHNYITVLHEVSHTICFRTGMNDGHGPVFMNVYVKLLNMFLHFDIDELYASLESWGIRVAEDEEAPRLRRQVLSMIA